MSDNKITQAQVDAEMKGDGDGYGGGISSKSAAELLGLSESALLEAHGDIIEKN